MIRKSNLMKIFLVMVISVILVGVSTNVFAANDNGFTDLTNTLNGTSNNTSSNSANTNTTYNNTSTNNTTNKTNTSSIYNNTNLPNTGVESSIPVAMIIVVLAISAIYAFKKIKDYNNV